MTRVFHLVSIIVAMGIVVSACDKSELSRDDYGRASFQVIDSLDADIRRVRIAETILNVPVAYGAEVNPSGLTIRTYWPGLPRQRDGVGERSSSDLIYISLRPSESATGRLPALGVLDGLIDLGTIESPRYDEQLKLYVYDHQNELPMYYRPTLETSSARNQLVFVCAANPNRAIENQLCSGHRRISAEILLQVRFNSQNIANWSDLVEDVHSLILSMLDE